MFVVLLGFCCVNSIIAQENLVFITKNLNFGTVNKSAPLKGYYSFKNNGKKPIKIKGITLSTLKIRVTYPHDVIQPNEQGTIEFIYDIQDAYVGYFRKSIKIKTSNENETIFLNLFGTISDVIPNKQKRCDNNFEWYRIYENGKYGAQNSNGTSILHTDYRILYHEANGFIAKKNDLWHYFTNTGKVVFSVECDEFYQSMDGFLAIQNQLCSLYDMNGKCIIPFSRNYLSLEKYHSETLGTYYKSKKENNNWVLCDESGYEVFSFKEKCKDFVPYYSIGRFVIIIQYSTFKYAIFDSKGNCVINNIEIEAGTVFSPYIDDKGNIKKTNIVDGKSDYRDNDRNVFDNLEYKTMIIGNIKQACMSTNPFTE